MRRGVTESLRRQTAVAVELCLVAPSVAIRQRVNRFGVHRLDEPWLDALDYREFFPGTLEYRKAMMGKGFHGDACWDRGGQTCFVLRRMALIAPCVRVSP